MAPIVVRVAEPLRFFLPTRHRRAAMSVPADGVSSLVHIVQPTPTSPPRFAADVHLGTLVRRLRLLGVDVTYRNDISDEDLITEAVRERRIVLSKDRGLLGRRGLTAGAYVRGDVADEQVADVLDRFVVPPAPFSRCLRCNGLLSPVAKENIVHLIPAGTRRSYDDFSRCAECGQVYWRGAHADALDAAITRARVLPAISSRK